MGSGDQTSNSGALNDREDRRSPAATPGHAENRTGDAQESPPRRIGVRKRMTVEFNRILTKLQALRDSMEPATKTPLAGSSTGPPDGSPGEAERAPKEPTAAPPPIPDSQASPAAPAAPNVPAASPDEHRPDTESEPPGPARSQEVRRVPEPPAPAAPVGPMAPDLATIVSFTGEAIYKDVKPTTHVAQPGETLESIAAGHLAGAGKDEIAVHMAEIERLNGLDTGKPLSEGRRLILPGHTADGGTVLRDAAGALHTHWPDGVQRLERGDGTGYVRRPTADGGMVEQHWGPRPEDNYELTRAPDGHYRLREHSGTEAVVPAHHRRVVRARWTTANQVDAAHQAAAALYGRLDLIEQRLDRGSRKDSAAFEYLRAIRAHTQELEVRARRDGLPPAEVARTYRELDQMLRSETTAPTTAGDRLRLAADVSRQAARPEEVNQGMHQTGGVAAIETRMYMKNPSAAPSLVREVATTGHFTESDRTVVQVLPESQASFHPDGDRQRSYGSQLFQLTAVNLHWAHHDLQDEKGQVIARAGRIRYEQHAPSTSPDGEPDSGERLMDYTHSPVRPPREIKEPGPNSSRPIAHPRLSAGDLTEISNRISGRNDQEIVLVNAAADQQHVIRFATEEELETVLADMKSQERFPMIMEVNAGSQPFFGILGGAAAGGAEGAHFITLSGYDPIARPVQFINQWSAQPDRNAQSPVSVRELYLSSMGCRSSALASALSEQHINRQDWPAVLELLWQKRSSGALPPERFIQDFASALNESHMMMMREWTSESRAAHHDLEIQFCKVFASLPVEEQEAVALHMDRENAMSLLSTIEQMHREG